MPLIETQNLTHVFPDGTVAIENINLKIYAGEFVIIAGENGSGKTVLARHLNGLLQPTKGQVLIEGQPICKNIVNARKKSDWSFKTPTGSLLDKPLPKTLLLVRKILIFPPLRSKQ